MRTKQKIISAVITQMLLTATAYAGTVVEKNGWAQIKGCDKDSPNYMLKHSGMSVGSCLVSENGIFVMRMRADTAIKIWAGNAPGIKGPHRSVGIWSSGAKVDSRRASITFQNDSNLVIYDKGIKSGGKARWSTGTHGTGRNVVVLSNWGELIVGEWGGAYGPTLNPNGRYKQQFARWNRRARNMTFGDSSKPVVVGRQVTKYQWDKKSVESHYEYPREPSAHVFINNCGGDNNSTGQLTLSGKVTNSTNWSEGKSISTSIATHIEVESKASAGVAKQTAKLRPQVQESLEAGRSSTRGAETSETNDYSKIANYDVKPGFHKTYSMSVEKQTFRVPYLYRKIIKPHNTKVKHGYISRLTGDDVYVSNQGRGARVSQGHLGKCT